jgi:membrane protease subunit HflK
MQQILSNTSKVIVDQKAGQNLLYLPLDRIMQMANPPQQGQGNDPAMPRTTLSTDVLPPSQPAAPPAAAEPAARTGRDALRSRER